MITRVLPCLPVLAILLAPGAEAAADGPEAVPPQAAALAEAAVVPQGDAGNLLAAASALVDPCALPADGKKTDAAPADANPAAAVDPSPLRTAAQAAGAAQAAPARRAVAYEYSDAYLTRLKIHNYASYATLPIFIAQTVVGQKLYNGDTSNGMRSAHTALVGATAVLFGVNTVTGVWNLGEGLKDPNHKTKRMVHGFTMLLADAGFVASGMMAPHRHHSEAGFETLSGSSPSTHRAVALTSMGLATVSYLMMLIH